MLKSIIEINSGKKFLKFLFCFFKKVFLSYPYLKKLSVYTEINISTFDEMYAIS